MPVVDGTINSNGEGNFFEMAGVVVGEHFRVSLATTQVDNTNDQVLCWLFPTDTELYLTRLEVDTSAMDSGSSLTLNIGVGDSDGTLDTTLISGSTAAQTGATDTIDATATIPLLVSGKYIIVDVGTAAATAVAGTLDFYIEYVKLSSGRRS